jgi:lactoylglutathione lyase
MTFTCAKSFAQQKMSPHINHVAVYVVDLQKSGDFYMNVLGLDSIPEPFHDGRHIWLRIGPGASMHIIQGAEAKKEYYKNNHFCFSVSSVEDFTALLRNKSIPYEDAAGRQMSVTTRVDGVKQIWLRDPDGYWLEINDDKDK